MNRFEAVDAIWLTTMLFVVTSALVARRLPASMLIKSALAWMAIGLVVYGIVAYRHDVAALFGAKPEPARDLRESEPQEDRHIPGPQEVRFQPRGGHDGVTPRADLYFT